jgi:antitoxin ParD1/3/4
MPITLSPDLQRQIEEKVESGAYDSADDVVRRAMQLLSEVEQEHAEGLEALRGKIQEGIDDLEDGRHSPIDEVFARLRARRGMPT